MKFSQSSQVFLGRPNALYLAQKEREQKGLAILDLVHALPGGKGLEGICPFSEKLEPIMQRALSEATPYEPDSMGQEKARAAICGYYAQTSLSPKSILLTPGTSVSYLYLFKLLADARDEFLCPSPSYPLFEYIAQMADVKITDYPLKECSEFPHWKLDLEELENRLTTKTKAIILISPHNPTGMVIDSQTFEAIAQIARRHALAIIYDEVFCEFLHTDECFPRGIGSVAPLVFTLNGISKMFGLPGMKLGWIAVSGDEKLVSQSVKRLEFMSDTFLPVSEPIQFALADIFANGKKHLHEVRSFLKENLHQTLKNLKGSAFLKPLTPSAGFYLPLQLNTQEADETIALELLQETGILVHPGAFYDMKGNHLILSLLQEKEKLHEGVYRLGQYFRTFL